MKVIEQSHASPMGPSDSLQGVHMRWFGAGKILQELNLCRLSAMRHIHHSYGVISTKDYYEYGMYYS